MIHYFNEFYGVNWKKLITNFVILALMQEQNLSFEATNEQLITVATQYTAVLKKATKALPSVDPGLLAGTSGTIYLKQKGHRALSSEDSENIIRSIGTDTEKETLTHFSQAQRGLSKRLTKNKWIGLICEQSGIPYLKVHRRVSKPELWTADEMLQVAQVMQRLQV